MTPSSLLPVTWWWRHFLFLSACRIFTLLRTTTKIYLIPCACHCCLLSSTIRPKQKTPGHQFTNQLAYQLSLPVRWSVHPWVTLTMLGVVLLRVTAVPLIPNAQAAATAAAGALVTNATSVTYFDESNQVVPQGSSHWGARGVRFWNSFWIFSIW